MLISQKKSAQIPACGGQAFNPRHPRSMFLYFKTIIFFIASTVLSAHNR